MINEQKMDETMLRLGFRENIKGTEYVRQAVRLWTPGAQYTKCVYPAVAAANGTTASRVERAIRHAIESACDRGSLKELMQVFGYSIDANKGKPTSSEFIARMARYCRAD